MKSRIASTLVAGALSLAATVLFGLAACGFRLAGSEKLPPVLARPYLSVKDPYTDFAREFERQLKSSGALVQDIRQDSTATIEVTKDLFEQRTLAVSATQYSDGLCDHLYGDVRRAGSRCTNTGAADHRVVAGLQLSGKCAACQRA